MEEQNAKLGYCIWQKNANYSYRFYFSFSLVFASVHNFFVFQPGQKWCSHNLACFIALCTTAYDYKIFKHLKKYLNKDWRSHFSPAGHHFWELLYARVKVLFSFITFDYLIIWPLWLSCFPVEISKHPSNEISLLDSFFK